jgi:predicted Zn-dependent protease
MKILVRVVVAIAVIAVGYFAFQKQQTAGLNNQAVKLMEIGDYRGALPILERAARESPGNASIQKNLQATREALGLGGDASDSLTVEEAAAVRERAAARIERMKAEGWKDDEETIELTLNAAEAMFQMGDLKSSILLLERALFKDPSDMLLEQRIENYESSLASKAPVSQ